MLLNKKFRPPYTTNKVLSPKLRWNKSRLRLIFKESCLKQEDTTPITPNNVVNLFIIYEVFRSVKITKNADTEKYSYTGYGIGFDSRSLFSIPNFDWVKNVVTFGVDMSSSWHVDNKGKDILILVRGPAQGLNGTTFTAKTEHSINFSRSLKKLFTFTIIMGAFTIFIC